MKIAIDSSILEYDGRGIAKTVVAFYTVLKRLYPEVELFLMQKKKLVTDFPVEHKKILSPIYLSEECAIKDYFPEQIKKLNIDFVHFPFNGNNAEYFSSVRPKTKIISTIHDIIPAMIPEIYNLSNEEVISYLQTAQKQINNTDILLTISKCSQHDIETNLKVKKEPIIIYNSHFSYIPQNKEKKYGKYFLYNGGYCPRKGIEFLVDNFLQLKLRGMLESKLILTGSVLFLSNRLQSLKNFGISRGWIIETGYIPDEELFNLFINAQALVYPSRYEGFGLPPLEAMNLGCPVITTRYSSLPEVCGDAAYYINRDNEEDFQSALIAIEQNPSLRKELIAKGKKQAEKFSWENTVKQFIKIIQQ